MSGSKRKTAGQSDFKRLKAKVGKKAKKLNDTDVTFRSASLHIGGQAVDPNKASQDSKSSALLVSSRGKALHDLLSVVKSHPAAAARCSSLRGILDIVKIHQPQELLPNLSALIPACIHSCVDEDQDVRSAGIEVLSALFSGLHEKQMKPFGVLLIARVSSALHSLDASTRIDGVRMTKLVTTSCPSLTVGSVDKLLPPFAGLLGDQRTRKATDEILQSLVSLLRVDDGNDYEKDRSMSTQGRNNTMTQQPNLIYQPGGRSRNVVLQSGRYVHPKPAALDSISDLVSFIEDSKNRNYRTSERPIKHKTNLLSRLRDSLIEAVNLENEAPATNRTGRSTTSESSTPSMNYPRIILLLRSIRWLLKNIRASSSGAATIHHTDIHKINRHIITVLLDVFPIDEEHKSSVTDDVNGAIAMAILEISDGGADDQEGESDEEEQCMRAIYSFVVPRINQLADAKNQSDSSHLDIICNFIRRLGLNNGFQEDLESVLRMLQDFFFKEKNIPLARSSAGRRISLIMMEMIQRTDFRLENEPNHPLADIFLHVIMQMTSYLEAWGSDFLYESRKILEGLHGLVRCTKEGCSLPVLDSLRRNWHLIVASKGDSMSIFEFLPGSLQKMYLSLIALLKSPSHETITSLTTICVRSECRRAYSDRSSGMGSLPDEIVEVVQSVRKTVPMQRYLTFLVQSMGISRHGKEILRFEKALTKTNPSSSSVFEKKFFLADPSINRIARALTKPGSLQVLRMVLPQLVSWLQVGESEHTKGSYSTEFLLKTRASHIVLAYFFLFHINASKQPKESGDGVSNILGGAKSSLTVDTLNCSISSFIRCVIRQETAVGHVSKLLAPSVAIMSCQPSMLCSVINEIKGWFEKGELSKLEQKHVLLILVDWMKDPRLKAAIHGSLSSSKGQFQQHVDSICCSEALRENELALDLIPLLTKT